MTSPAIPALVHALALFKAPRSARPGPDERLPEGMLQLLRIVAGEEQALSLAQGLTGESAESLREAAGFYIQQVMFGPNSNSYRILGVDTDAPDERIREHFRWLARWLHPDRNSDEWENIYVDRVNSAWQHLRTTERRLQYDQSLHDSSAAPERVQPRVLVKAARQVDRADLDSPSLDLRWLPKAIFAGLGASALATVAIFYVLENAETRPNQETTMAEEAPMLAPVQLSLAPGASLPDPAPVKLAVPAVLKSATVNLMSAKVASPAPKTSAPHKSTTLRAAVQTKVERPRGNAATISVELPVATQEKASPPSTPIAVATSVSEPIVQSVRAVDSTSHPAPRISSEEMAANRVLGHFSQAYADGNLDGMRAMFTADARSPRGGLGAILANYERVFDSSIDRSLVVHDVSWFTSGATLTIIASYQATVTNVRGRRSRRTHGDIRLDLRREEEQWRIYRLLHDERPG